MFFLEKKLVSIILFAAVRDDYLLQRANQRILICIVVVVFLWITALVIFLLTSKPRFIHTKRFSQRRPLKLMHATMVSSFKSILRTIALLSRVKHFKNI